MKQTLDKPQRQKDAIKILTQSQKMYPRTSTSIQFRMLSPKAEIMQPVVLPRSEANEKIIDSTHLLKANADIIVNHLGSQHRKDLVQNQQRRAKISLQAAVAKKQLDFAERKKDVLTLENNKLKIELNLLQMELRNLKENQQRLKRKHQVQLHQNHSQMQKNANLIAELQQNIQSLTMKTQNIVNLQRQVSILENQKLKVNQQLQKLKKTHSQVVERNRSIQYNYKSLFQNYAKLEVNFQSLQRDLHITKEYLSKTQALHCQTKQQSFKMYQQKTKQLEQKSSIIASLTSQLSSSHQKVQKMNMNEQKRQKLIDQYKTIIQNQKSSRIACLLQKSKLQSEITSITRKVNVLQEENQSCNEQIAKLKIMCQFQQQQLKEQEIYCQQMQQVLQKLESEWALTIKHQLSRISDQKLQYITKLEQQLQLLCQNNKELKQKFSKKEWMASQKFDETKTQSQHSEKAFLSQSPKNQNLAVQIAHKQAENFGYRGIIKIKSEELESQVHSLSILLINETAKTNAERQKNRQLQNKIKIQHQHIQQLKQQAASDYSQKIRNLTLEYQKQKDQLFEQVKRQKKQNAVLRKELQLMNSWLLANNDNITAIIKQLQLLKKRVTSQNSNIGLIKKSEKCNGTIIQVNQQVVLDNSNDQLFKRGFLNCSLDFINKEMLEMKGILTHLKQERQLFVQKYIEISNEVARIENTQKSGSKIEIMEGHFTQLSLLHTQLNNALSRVQNKLAEISITQKGLQMGDILAKTI